MFSLLSGIFFFASPVSNFGSYVSLTVTAEEAGRSFRYTDAFFFFFFFFGGVMGGDNGN